MKQAEFFHLQGKIKKFIVEVMCAIDGMNRHRYYTTAVESHVIYSCSSIPAIESVNLSLKASFIAVINTTAIEEPLHIIDFGVVNNTILNYHPNSNTLW